MAVIQGNTTGSIASVAFNIPCKIISGFLVNRTGGSITFNVYVVTDTGERSIVPFNKTVVSGQLYLLEDEVIMKAGWYLLIFTSGSLDYFFSIK